MDFGISFFLTLKKVERSANTLTLTISAENGDTYRIAQRMKNGPH